MNILIPVVNIIVQVAVIAGALAIVYYFVIYRNPERLKILKQLTGKLFQKRMSREEKEIYDKYYFEEYDKVFREEIEKKARADARREAKKRYGSDKE